MKIRLAPRPQKGTSLVEVIFAIAIIAICSVGLLGSLSYGFFVMQLARENQRATQIMLEKIETIRLYSWSQVISNGFIPSTFTQVYDPQATNGASGTVFNGTLLLTNFPSASYSTNLRQLTVTVNWNTKTVPRTRSITTFIARSGLQNYVY